MKKTKFSKLVNEKIDSSKTHTIDEAISLLMEFKKRLLPNLLMFHIIWELILGMLMKIFD